MVLSVRTEQEPHPQLEQSPLQEQELQLLLGHGQLTLSFYLMHTGHQGVPRSTQHQKSVLQDWSLVRVRAGVTYHGDMMNVIGW